MTNEEAIKILDTGKNFAYDEKYVEAFDMAIAALKAQPCEDAISREEMRKVINECEKYNSPVWVWREALAALPPVQPESRWIPVSEGVPEEGEEVIVTTRYRFFDQDKDEHDIKMLIYTGKDELGHTFLTHSGSCERNIIAWMPKPVPYKKGEEK